MSIPLRSGYRWMSNWGSLWVFLLFAFASQAQNCGEDIVIVGSDYVCAGDSAGHQYTAMIPGNSAGTWSIEPMGGGVITTANPANSVIIEWNGAPGTYEVIVEFENYRLGCIGFYYDTLEVVIEDDFGIAMACNDTVQLSLGIDCQADVLADLLLEGGTSMNEDFEVIVIDENGMEVPDAMLDGSHIGQLLEVTVRHLCSGNYCSGYIFVEDKLRPSLDCGFYEIECDQDPTPGADVGFPFSDIGTTVTENPDGSYTVTGIDSCSDVTLTYVDDVVQNDCPPLVPHIDTIFRTWLAVDASGNDATCVDTIAVLIGAIDSVVCPPNWDGIDTITLQCNGVFPVDSNGHPHPDYTGYPSGVSCRNMDADYVDFRLGPCNGTYKIIREWLIADWCTGRQIFCNQIIKVEDNEGPTVICPPTDTFSVSQDQCLGEAIVPNPMNFVDMRGECSSIATVEVYVRRGAPDCNAIPDFDETTTGVFRLPNGDYRIIDLPLGCNWVTYRYVDDCGNASECRFSVFIKEDSKPVPVCDQHTTVTLSTHGFAKVFAETFDDGSYDNCSIGHFEVRRMLPGDCANGVADDTLFRDYVEFCCEDAANSPIVVVMRVYDRSGNFNECMVEVNVVDKKPPTLVCPPNITVSCDYAYTDINEFGYMRDNEADRDDIIIPDTANPRAPRNYNWGLDGYYEDECEANLTYRERDLRNDCGVGTILREWTVSDANSRVACTQRVRFLQYNAFDGTGIDWPDDMEIYGCGSDVSPDETGEPDLPGTGVCADLLVSFEDQVYDVVPDACYKILRLWTVVDWCNPNTASNRFTYTQVIKILNTDDPYFESGCRNIVFDTDDPNCIGFANLSVEVNDDCTDKEDLIVSYTIDEFKDGDIDYSQSGTNNASNTYPVGTHEICWTVKDKCDNTSTCCHDFIIRDDKDPVPYCKTGIITVVMPTSGEITIWASDLDEGSYDNCTPQTGLRFSFSTDINDNQRTYDCSDIPNGIEETFDVRVYVWDEFGNGTYCETTITIQDGIDDVCPDNVTGGGTAMLAGNIVTESSETVEEVMVMLDGQMPGLPKYEMTHTDGHYAFPSIPVNHSYRIEASRNDDALNGVTTLDLVLIQRHLLGISSFNTPYTYIAADVNNTESVTAGDISELRKLILGYYAEFPKNKSWRFVSQDHQFQDPQDPWPFDEDLEISDLTQDVMANDFVAVKVGDINGDAKANGLLGNVVRSGAAVSITTEDKSFEQGDLVEIALDLEKGEYTGFQYALQFDVNKLQLANIQHNSGKTTDGNLGLARLDHGVISVSWNAQAGQAEMFDQPHLTLSFEAMASGRISEIISLNTKVMPSEAYDAFMEVAEISFDYLDNKGEVIASSNEFELLQNKPNPFDNSTVIGFTLPRTQDAHIKVLDVNGKVVKSISGVFAKGFNQITISKNDLGTSGVLYYRLETDDRMATRKMILIE